MMKNNYFFEDTDEGNLDLFDLATSSFFKCHWNRKAGYDVLQNLLYFFIISWTAHSVPYHVDLIKLEPALVVRRAAMLRSPRTISISTQVLFSRQWLGSFWSQCRRNVCVYYYSSVSGVSCWSNATSTGKLPQNEAYPSIFDPIRSSAFFQ